MYSLQGIDQVYIGINHYIVPIYNMILLYGHRYITHVVVDFQLLLKSH